MAPAAQLMRGVVMLPTGRFNILATVASAFVAFAAMTIANTALAAAPAAADDSSDERRMMAQTLLEQGVKLADSDPKGALNALRSSYEVQSDYRVLYQVGKVCTRLKDSSCAVRAFEQYLRDGGTDVPTKRRKELEAQIKTLSSTLATLTIKSSIKNADVKIDGVVVGKTPLAQALTVNAGTHRIVLLAGDGNVEKSVQIAAGGSESVELESKAKADKEDAAVAAALASTPTEVAKAAPSSPPTPSATTEQHKSPPRAGVPILPWVATVLLAGGTVATGILTAQANDRYNAMKDVYPITRDELEASHDKAQNLLFLTGGLGVATLVSLGIAGYSTLTRGAGAPAPSQDKMVGVAVGPNGISVSGRIP